MGRTGELIRVPPGCVVVREENPHLLSAKLKKAVRLQQLVIVQPMRVTRSGIGIAVVRPYPRRRSPARVALWTVAVLTAVLAVMMLAAMVWESRWWLAAMAAMVLAWQTLRVRAGHRVACPGLHCQCGGKRR